MLTFVIILHVLVSFFMILVVLLQPGTKGGMGSAFGGAGGATVFGGRGANTFLAKLTAGGAVVFMVTNFSLVYFSSRSGSAFDRAEIEAASGAAADADGEKDAAAAGAEGAEGEADQGNAAPAEAPAANPVEAAKPADAARTAEPAPKPTDP
jgi:preprotein translocase subunit SecG